ncbi:MAG: preprotein translocase subunit Sec61beta [Candidatus Woesearchaeota archaeon]
MIFYNEFKMSDKNKISLPSTGGGIVRYFDESKSKFTIKPTYVLVIIGVVILLSLLLHKLKPLG